MKDSSHNRNLTYYLRVREHFLASEHVDARDRAIETKNIRQRHFNKNVCVSRRIKWFPIEYTNHSLPRKGLTFCCLFEATHLFYRTHVIILAFVTTTKSRNSKFLCVGQEKVCETWRIIIGPFMGLCMLQTILRVS